MEWQYGLTADCTTSDFEWACHPADDDDAYACCYSKRELVQPVAPNSMSSDK